MSRSVGDTSELLDTSPVLLRKLLVIGLAISGDMGDEITTFFPRKASAAFTPTVPLGEATTKVSIPSSPALFLASFKTSSVLAEPV